MNAPLKPSIVNRLFATADLVDDTFDVPARRHRAIWISDVHLGTAGCKAEFLIDFLKHNESDVLYLVGDIIDGWQLKKGWTWRQSHNDVVQKILRKAPRAPRSSSSPATTTSSHATTSTWPSAASTWCSRRRTSRPTAGSCSSRTGTSSTA